MPGHDGKPAAIARMLGNDGHVASNCPLWRRLKDPENFSSGFIVRQDWRKVITIVHNVNKDNAAQMGPGGTEAHINAMLVRYAQSVSRLYNLRREGNTLIIVDRR